MFNLIQIEPITGTQWGGSRLSEFDVCQQKYKWHYVDGLVPRAEGEAASFGSAFHEALRGFYSDKTDRPYEERCLDAIHVGVNYCLKAPETPERALLVDEVMAGLDQYFIHYRADTMKVSHVEQSYSMMIRGFPSTGRMDLIAEITLADGKLFRCVPDHKTTGLDWGRFWKKWRFDLSLKGYVYAARKYFNDSHIQMYINAIRRRKTKNFELEFQRDIIFYDDNDMKDFEDSVESLHLDIIDRMEGKRVWRKNGKACVGLLDGECKYRRLCEFPSEEMKNSLYTRVEVK